MAPFTKMQATLGEKEKARRAQTLILALMGAFILVPMVIYYLFH